MPPVIETLKEFGGRRAVNLRTKHGEGSCQDKDIAVEKKSLEISTNSSLKGSSQKKHQGDFEIRHSRITSFQIEILFVLTIRIFSNYLTSIPHDLHSLIFSVYTKSFTFEICHVDI